jgi:integral membrane protein
VTTNSLTSPRKLFMLFALGEALTWTLLLGALAFRAVMGAPPLMLTIVGGIHGAVFLGYAVTASVVGVNQRWGFWRIALAVVLAIVPYATIPFERRVDSKGLLVGDWRRTESSDPRDANWFDRLFRWFINRPALLVVTMLIAVAAIFTILLLIGPPGGSPAE